MKILVVSDTHGYETNLKKVLGKVGKIDHLIHCGDVEEHEREIEEMAGVPCTFVRGNNDYSTDLPRDTIVTFGTYRIFVTHGHLYNLDKLPPLHEGDILLHGHTHVPACAEREGVTYLNPGSLSMPKENSPHSYMTLEDGLFLWKELESGQVYREFRV